MDMIEPNDNFFKFCLTTPIDKIVRISIKKKRRSLRNRQKHRKVHTSREFVTSHLPTRHAKMAKHGRCARAFVSTSKFARLSHLCFYRSGKWCRCNGEKRYGWKVDERQGLPLIASLARSNKHMGLLATIIWYSEDTSRSWFKASARAQCVATLTL